MILPTLSGEWLPLPDQPRRQPHPTLADRGWGSQLGDLAAVLRGSPLSCGVVDALELRSAAGNRSSSRIACRIPEGALDRDRNALRRCHGNARSAVRVAAMRPYVRPLCRWRSTSCQFECGLAAARRMVACWVARWPEDPAHPSSGLTSGRALGLASCCALRRRRRPRRGLLAHASDATR